MKFCNQLNLIFTKTGFSNKAVADSAQLDSSLMSKYRNGKREPWINSPQIKKICRAFITLAEEKNILEDLCDYCQINYTGNKNLLISKFEYWLTNDTDLKIKKSTAKKELDLLLVKNNALFNQKIDNLFNVFKIPNHDLAQLLYVDQSLISKLRKGLRDFSANETLIHKLCNIFADISLTWTPKKYEHNFQTLIGHVPNFSKDDIANALIEWLKEEDENTINNEHIKKFLSFFDNYKRSSDVPNTIINNFMPKNEKLFYSNQTFMGIKGLQQAVLQQLLLLSAQSTPHTLYFYSEQPLTWISDFPEYSKTWDILMNIIIQKKHQIFIVNHFNRAKKEMDDSLQRWLPLYMSCQLNAVFSEFDSSSKFRHTLFLVPNLCSIESNFIAGTENEASYAFSIQKSKLDYQFSQFNALIQRSKPFLKVLNLDEEADYQSYIKSAHNLSVSAIRASFTPLISTMPPALFKKILAANSLNQKDLAFAWKYYNDSKLDFYNHLKSDQIIHFIKCPTQEDYLAEKIPVDLPIKNIYYTKDHLKEHLAHIKELLKKNNNYRFYPAPSIFPSGLNFPSSSIFILHKNTNVIALQKNISYRAFVIESPKLSMLINRFYKNLKLLDAPKDYDYKNCIATFMQNMLPKD